MIASVARVGYENSRSESMSWSRSGSMSWSNSWSRSESMSWSNSWSRSRSMSWSRSGSMSWSNSWSRSRSWSNSWSRSTSTSSEAELTAYGIPESGQLGENTDKFTRDEVLALVRWVTGEYDSWGQECSPEDAESLLYEWINENKSQSTS